MWCLCYWIRCRRHVRRKTHCLCRQSLIFLESSPFYSWKWDVCNSFYNPQVLGQHFKVETNHYSLKYLLEQHINISGYLDSLDLILKFHIVLVNKKMWEMGYLENWKNVCLSRPSPIAKWMETLRHAYCKVDGDITAWMSYCSKTSAINLPIKLSKFYMGTWVTKVPRSLMAQEKFCSQGIHSPRGLWYSKWRPFRCL